MSTRALVFSMLGPSDELRDGLLAVLETEGVPEVRAQATAARSEATAFLSEELNLSIIPHPSSAATWQTYRIDVFWCNSKSNKEDATRIRDRLVKAGGNSELIRLRPLPQSINESPGDRIEGMVIRRDQNEEAVAPAIKKETESAFDGAAPGFVLTSSRQSTVGYLSVFVYRKGSA